MIFKETIFGKYMKCFLDFCKKRSKTLKSNTRLFFSFNTFCCLKTRPIIKANKRKYQYSLCTLYMYLTEHFNSFNFYLNNFLFFIENRKNSELSIILYISIYTILFDFLEKYIIQISKHFMLNLLFFSVIFRFKNYF